MTKYITEHNCLSHLDEDCKCAVCGQTLHNIVSDSKGFGTGHVTDRCVRCNKFERYYDDTGTIIESTFRSDF
jgi:hypothetical protein